MAAVHEGLYEDILVHRCEPCASLWMTAPSLDRLDDNIDVDASRIEWEATGAEDGMRCPSCAGGYRTANPMLESLTLPDRRDIVVHRCSECESFLLTERALDDIRGHIAGRAVPEFAEPRKRDLAMVAIFGADGFKPRE